MKSSSFKTLNVLALTVVSLLILSSLFFIGCSQNINALIQKLNDKDTDVRWKTAKKLVRIGPPAVDTLIIALRNEDPDIRLWVAIVLGEIKDPRAVTPLITALKDNNSDVRDKAALALSHIGAPAVDSLIGAMNNEDLNVRKGATWALAKIKDPRAVEPLIAAALKDTDAEVRRSAVETLASIKDPRAVEPLIDILKDQGSGIRQTVAESLGEIKNSRAVEPLFLVFENDLKAEPSFFHFENSAKKAQISARNALIKIVESDINIAISALNNKRAGLRVFGTRALEKMKDPRAMQYLIAALKERDPNVKIEAISILLRKGDQSVRQPEIIDWLVSFSANLLTDDGNWLNYETAQQFYYTLKQFESKSVIDSLVRHLFKPKIRLHTLILGVKMGIPGSTEKLIDTLMRHGNKSMAEDFLNSGSQSLEDGGVRWANAHGYSIRSGSGSHRAQWGKF